MTFSSKNFNAKGKRILSTFFSIVLFLGCAIFVASRGYICFEKFLGKPEKVDISFKFTGTQKFPSISICTKRWFNEDVFDECQLSVSNYTSRESPVWVGHMYLVRQSTLGAEMFGLSDFWLETRVIIKILTNPC